VLIDYLILGTAIGRAPARFIHCSIQYALDLFFSNTIQCSSTQCNSATQRLWLLYSL